MKKGLREIRYDEMRHEERLKEYAEKTKDFLALIETGQKKEQSILAEIENGHPESAILRLALAKEMLNLTSVFVAINDVSQSVLSKRDENAINTARKFLNKGLNYLESVVTKAADAPFSVYEKQIDEIAAFSPSDRYHLIQKTGLVISLLQDTCENDPKWKGTIVEFEGRLAIIAKNIINLRDVTVNSYPRSPHYEPTVYHVRLVKKLLAEAADRYREKYEVYSRGIDDFKIAIIFLRSLAMFDIFTGDQAEAEEVKKKLGAWKNKLNMDIKIQQSEKG
jgi:hypothetical protein